MRYVNRWNELAAKLKPSLQKGLQATGEQAVSFIQGNAPRRSGFMADNVYCSGPLQSTYGAGGSPSNDDAYLLPEVSPPNDMTAIVGAAANYSIFVDMGHHTRSGSFVPANPFFDRGVEQTRGVFETIMAAELATGLV